LFFLRFSLPALLPFSCFSKPILAAHRFRKTWQDPGKALPAMDWTSLGRQTDVSFVNENACNSIRRNTELDLIETDESDLK
jgi:hypothetical protein